MRALLLGSSVLIALSTSVPAAGLTITAGRDATLIEDPNGALANGAGPLVFAGRTNATNNGVRRALLRFDLATDARGGRPVTAAIETVAVFVTNLTESNVAPREYRLHRLLADWGEGTSSTSGGGGVPAAPNDATWLHAFFPDAFWIHNGAQFDGEPSARLIVAGPGVYRFQDEGLLRDVKLWVLKPEKNFGWILIGDEAYPQTVRAFASRENPDATVRPVLEIGYRNDR